MHNMSNNASELHLGASLLGPDNRVYSSYLPDGTLMARQFRSVRTRTVVRVNSKGDTIVRTIREPVIDHTRYRGDWEIDGSGTVWRLNTPEGIATVVKNGTTSDAGRTFTHLWYVRDRLGSVRTVMDDNGTIRQCTMFYPSGLPVQLFGTERMTDRAHIGNRWSDFAGLGWHDNTARWHDAILGRFTTPDPKAADYPSFSPYTHCAANPLRFTDPTGMVVYADDWCVQGILDGLSSEEQKYIQFNNGVLDADLIASCENPSANLEILQALASSSIKYIFNGADKVMLGDNTERALRGNTENGGTVGVTLMPYHDGLESFENTYESPDKDVHIYTSLNVSEAKRASNIAHEGYGHGYFYEKSLTDKSFDPFHRYGTQGYILEYDPETQMNMSIFQIGLTNQKLENHIKAVEIRALLNQTINYVFRTINR